MIGKIKRNLRDLSNLQPHDTLLVSYPKSGNTWIRFLICNYIEYLRATKQVVDFTFLNKNMPELAYNLHQNTYFEKRTSRMVKTHKNYLFLFRKNPSIYIIRNPISVLKSFYIYNNHIENSYFQNYSFSQFIQSPYGINGYLNHYNSWQNHIGLLIKYEDLQTNTYTTFNKLLMYLEYPIFSDGINYAIRMSAIEKVGMNNGGHKEQLTKGYNFVANNAKKSNLSLDNQDIEFVVKAIKSGNFNIYSVDDNTF